MNDNATKLNCADESRWTATLASARRSALTVRAMKHAESVLCALFPQGTFEMRGRAYVPKLRGPGRHMIFVRPFRWTHSLRNPRTGASHFFEDDNLVSLLADAFGLELEEAECRLLQLLETVENASSGRAA